MNFSIYLPLTERRLLDRMAIADGVSLSAFLRSLVLGEATMRGIAIASEDPVEADEDSPSELGEGAWA